MAKIADLLPMEIHGDLSKITENFEPKLKPLFDAMAAGKVIKKITCMAGVSNKDNREKDFVLQNIVATDYWLCFQRRPDESYVDYVDYKNETEVNPVNNKLPKSFYMNWVLSFEL